MMPILVKSEMIKKFMSMMEDFWLPRREGGRGTEITTTSWWSESWVKLLIFNYFPEETL